MSILIKGVEMPEKGECGMILFVYASGKVCINVNRKVGEAVPVPTPHGRLVELNLLISNGVIDDYDLHNIPTLAVIQNATVIEAEE